MNMKWIVFGLVLVLGLMAVFFVALGGVTGQRLDPASQYGPNPVLPLPQQSLIPVLNPPKAIGWAAGAMPVAAEGLEGTAFASRLDHPRWLYTLPNGDVLVAESNGPRMPRGLEAGSSSSFKVRPERAYRAQTASRYCAMRMGMALQRCARSSWMV
jgi:glucose/arabinose dehydrogenase